MSLTSSRASQPEPVSLASGLVPSVAARRSELGDSHAHAVQRMFDRISPTYDLLNRLLSLGIDRRWRTLALEALGRDLPDGTLLDVCAGTLDLSLAMHERWPVRTLLSLDFARDMLLAEPRDVDLVRQISGRLALEIEGRRRRRWTVDVGFGKTGVSAGRPRSTMRIDAATFEGMRAGTIAPMQTLL